MAGERLDAKRLAEEIEHIRSVIAGYGPGISMSVSAGEIAAFLDHIGVQEKEIERLKDTSDALRVILLDHWPAQVICDHEALTDQVVCSCSRVTLPVCPTVGGAVAAWIEHVLELLDTWTGSTQAARLGETLKLRGDWQESVEKLTEFVTDDRAVSDPSSEP